MGRRQQQATTKAMGKTPPGPSILEWPKWINRIRSNTFEAFTTLARMYGEEASVVKVPFLPGRWLYLCTRPEASKWVLQENQKNYRKAFTYNFLKPVVGEGLLTSEGDFWLRQRRLVAPLFHRKQLDSYGVVMQATIEELLEDWDRLPKGALVDVSAAMSQVTLSIAGKLLFNRDIGRDARWIGDAMVLLFRDVNERILSVVPIPRQVPTPHNRRVQEALDRLESMVYGLIAERRGREEAHDDLLSLFMLAEDEDAGRRMTDREIRDELLTFVIAGHDTTSNLMSWALYLLSKHPSIRRKLREEVVAKVAGRVPTLEEARELTYTSQVIDETLRLYPPAWVVEREPIEDDVIDGYYVEAGNVVSTGPYFIHHNAGVWKNPEGFDPDRFAAGGEAESLHRYAHFPFGGGPRKCVGADFALLEARLLLAAIVKNYDVDLQPASFVEAEGTVTLYPKKGMPMLVTRLA
jgi:cytochrome P450